MLLASIQDAAQLLAHRSHSLRALTHLHCLLSSALRALHSKLPSKAKRKVSGTETVKLLKLCLRKLYFLLVWLAAPSQSAAATAAFHADSKGTTASMIAREQQNGVSEQGSSLTLTAQSSADLSVSARNSADQHSELGSFGLGDGAAASVLAQTAKQIWEFVHNCGTSDSLKDLKLPRS